MTDTRARTGATAFDQYFRVTERGSTYARELRGGVVTFLTMAYIIVLNPLILLSGVDAQGERLAGGDAAAIAAATALVAGVLSILMGVVANYPLAMATGLGLNAFVTFAIASQMTWADAMGLVVIEGLIILVLVLTGFRQAVFHAFPTELKIAISVGIGLFITLIGFVDAGFVHRMPLFSGSTVPVTLGWDGQLQGWPVLVFIVGLLLLVALHVRRVKGAILITIAASTLLAIVVEKLASPGATGPFATYDWTEETASGALYDPHAWNLTVPGWPSEVVAWPDFSLLGEFNLLGGWEAAGVVTAALFVFTLLLADFFDTLGTMTAIGSEGDLLDQEGNPPHAKRILVVDSVGAALGGAAGVSSNTSYIESASGVAEGARTGLASVVTGVLFLLATFLTPLVTIVPSEAAAPALILVGCLMMQQVGGIDWDDVETAVPAFLTVALMPFTYSITAGIGAGVVSWVLIKVAVGKTGAIHPLMWVVAASFALYFAIHPVTGWLT